MKVGVAQINPIVGDLIGNYRKIINGYKALCEGEAELVFFLS